MNGICHIEIPSKDYEKAKKFYSAVFGWECQDLAGMDYVAYKPPGGPGGGFDKTLEIAPKPGISIYIEVEDIEATIKKAEGLGGKCTKEKTQISPEYGYYAFLADLEGNQIGLWAKN
ncbi:MAG: VOC family protein [Candidatus Zixiibacteriota bacterium]|nr:MAG: VOC family protein [candidate division Zixibacteria bacterium]